MRNKNPFCELTYYQKELDVLEEKRTFFDKKIAKVLNDKTCHRFKVSGNHGIVEWNFRFDDHAPKQLVMIANREFNNIHGLKLTIPTVEKLHKFLGQFLEFHSALRGEEG